MILSALSGKSSIFVAKVTPILRAWDSSLSGDSSAYGFSKSGFRLIKQLFTSDYTFSLVFDVPMLTVYRFLVGLAGIGATKRGLGFDLAGTGGTVRSYCD